MTRCPCGAIAVFAALLALPVLSGAGEPEAEREPFVRLFAVGVDKPGGLAFDGRLLWVADRVGLSLRGLDPKTGTQVETLPSPGTWPTGLAWDGALLWVADKDKNLLFGIDPRSRLVERQIESPSNPLGLAFDGEHLWVSDGRRLHRVTREDGTTIVSFDAPPCGPGARAMEQLGLAFHAGYLWVSDRKANRIYKVHAEERMVVDAMPSPGPFPAGLEIVDGRLLVVDVDSRAVHGLDLASIPRVVRADAKRERVVLRRRLTNRGPDALAAATINIAIPSSTPSQALIGEPTFAPAPSETTKDRWGQRVARFFAKDLAPQGSLDVEMTVSATLFSVRYHIDPELVGSLRTIPKKVRDEYLADGTKYLKGHPSIAKHLEAALGDERRPYWMVRKIARYIGEKMEYELTGGWNVAPTVIDRGTGSCSEYTFVFIAMCRAAGIPARYVGAVVVRGDDASTDDVFHRWAEVYLPGYGWVPADAQAADKPTPEEQAAGFTALDNRFLVTTTGGGGSEHLEWYYNSAATWTCRGRCDVQDLHLGDWYPEGKAAGGQP